MRSSAGPGAIDPESSITSTTRGVTSQPNAAPCGHPASPSNNLRSDRGGFDRCLMVSLLVWSSPDVLRSIRHAESGPPWLYARRLGRTLEGGPMPSATVVTRRSSGIRRKSRLSARGVAGAIALGVTVLWGAPLSASAGTLALPVAQPVPGTEFLTDVSCASTTFCVAIGYDPEEPFVVPITDGVAGAPEGIPGYGQPGTPTNMNLNGVTCTSKSSCIAVGTGEIPDPPSPRDGGRRDSPDHARGARGSSTGVGCRADRGPGHDHLLRCVLLERGNLYRGRYGYVPRRRGRAHHRWSGRKRSAGSGLSTQ